MNEGDALLWVGPRTPRRRAMMLIRVGSMVSTSGWIWMPKASTCSSLGLTWMRAGLT